MTASKNEAPQAEGTRAGSAGGSAKIKIALSKA